MSCNGNHNCTCDCCAGIAVYTPAGESNPPGLSAITYRTGIWATFKESMLARLSSSDYPALAGLLTRDDDDYSIALLDASSVVMDILTFYQERLANESYLRTATQLNSLTWLSQLAGYQPSPGVSASTYLAFTLTAAPGSPQDPATTAITIPAGTQVQSVPAQGQTPQSFETSADIFGKPDWNALPVLAAAPWKAKGSAQSVYLAGTATQLQPGDMVLLAADPVSGASPAWLIAAVTSVTPDTINQRTLVTWSAPLNKTGTFSAQAMKFYALRQRAALFGYNAINPTLLSSASLNLLKQAHLLHDGDWYFGKGAKDAPSSPLALDLDAVYSKVVANGWLVLLSPASSDWDVQVHPIDSVATASRSDYGQSGKVTRVTLASQSSADLTSEETQLADFEAATRSTTVLTQSDGLTIAEQPLGNPLYGTQLDLAVVRQDLIGITAVAITGTQQMLSLNPNVSLTFTPDDGTDPVTLNPGDAITLLQPPNLFRKNGSLPQWSKSDKKLTLSVADSSGRSGTISTEVQNLSFAAAPSSAPVAQEVALVASIAVVPTPYAHTRITLATPLVNCYDRSVTTVNANVGVATGGRSVTEILGNGSAATPNQAFVPKQTPLTYTQAQTPTGRADTLTVRANGAAWTEVQTLYQQEPTAKVYEVTNLAGGAAKIQFGDNIEGATLPTGQSNIVATYRIGLGSAGNVAAGAITTLVDRPLGVKGVTNPMAASGGQDPQSVADIRANAPQGVLTLGRAVSITDYQELAATFAGISKAYALWIPNGVNRGVFITVAGVNGAALPPGNLTLANLTGALRGYGNPHVAVNVQSFYETVFRITASIAYDPAYDSTVVQTAITTLLRSSYSFGSRNFGEGVSADEVAALIQTVTGVLACNVTKLKVIATSAAGDLSSANYSVSAWNNWIAQPVTLKRPCAGPARICPYIPTATIGALPSPAEILVLDPSPKGISLEVMA